MQEQNTLPTTGFIRASTVLTFVPFSRTTLWRKCKDGTFPKPMQLSKAITAWRVEDVRAWIEAQGGQQVV